MFFPEQINAKLLTHVCYGFAKISKQNQVEAFEWNDVLDYTDGMYVVPYRTPSCETGDKSTVCLTAAKPGRDGMA